MSLEIFTLNWTLSKIRWYGTIEKIQFSLIYSFITWVCFSGMFDSDNKLKRFEIRESVFRETIYLAWISCWTVYNLFGFLLNRSLISKLPMYKNEIFCLHKVSFAPTLLFDKEIFDQFDPIISDHTKSLAIFYLHLHFNFFSCVVLERAKSLSKILRFSNRKNIVWHET